MKKILCIGHASYDYTLPLDFYPKENTKNRILEKYECGGGPACNAAFLLAKWGCESYFMGTVGSDNEGKKILKELKEANVNIDYIEVLKNKETTKSTIIVNKCKGTRTILTYRDITMKLENNDIDFTPDVILVDGQELDASIKIIKENKNAISILDAGTLKKETLELAKIVDYLVCSKDFAEQYTKIKIDYDNEISMRKILSILETDFNNKVIVTLEDKGSMYRYNRQFTITKSIEVKPVDTTGAGDIFHGAFAYGILNEMDLKDIIKLATVTAGLSVTRLGSRNSVFSIEEVKKECEKHDI